MVTLFFSDEHNMLIEMISDFAKSEITPIAREIDQNSRFPSEVISKLGDLGILSIPVPKKYGGSGMDNVAYAAAIMELAKADASIAITVAAHTSLGTMPIVLSGSDEQKKKYVPKLASGEWMGCYCLTEPGAGSDANSGKTKAVLTEDEKHYLITGQKMWISNAGFADVFIVFARIEDDKNITGFILEKGMEGITLGEEEHKLGLNSSSTRQVFFNDVKVPVENMQPWNLVIWDV